MATGQKVIDANNIRNGDTIASVDKKGNVQKLLRAISNGSISNILNNRLRA